MNRPKTEWTDLLAGAFIYFGFLLFLANLHLLTINTEGNTSDVLNTLFVVFVTIYSFAVVWALAGLIIQLLRWLTWSVKTAEWQKKKGR